MSNKNIEVRAENIDKSYLNEIVVNPNLFNRLNNESITKILGPKGCGKTFKVLELIEYVLKELYVQDDNKRDESSAEYNSREMILKEIENRCFKTQDPKILYLHYSHGNFGELNLENLIPHWTEKNKVDASGRFGNADIIVIDDIHYALDDILESTMEFAENCQDKDCELPKELQSKVDSLVNLLDDAINHAEKGKSKLILVSEDTFSDKTYLDENFGIFESIDPRFKEIFEKLEKYESLEVSYLNKGAIEFLFDDLIVHESLKDIISMDFFTPRAAIRLVNELRNPQVRKRLNIPYAIATFYGDDNECFMDWQEKHDFGRIIKPKSSDDQFIEKYIHKNRHFDPKTDTVSDHDRLGNERQTQTKTFIPPIKIIDLLKYAYSNMSNRLKEKKEIEKIVKTYDILYSINNSPLIKTCGNRTDFENAFLREPIIRELIPNIFISSDSEGINYEEGIFDWRYSDDPRHILSRKIILDKIVDDFFVKHSSSKSYKIKQALKHGLGPVLNEQYYLKEKIGKVSDN